MGTDYEEVLDTSARLVADAGIRLKHAFTDDHGTILWFPTQKDRLEARRLLNREGFSNFYGRIDQLVTDQDGRRVPHFDERARVLALTVYQQGTGSHETVVLELQNSWVQKREQLTPEQIMQDLLDYVQKMHAIIETEAPSKYATMRKELLALVLAADSNTPKPQTLSQNQRKRFSAMLPSERHERPRVAAWVYRQLRNSLCDPVVDRRERSNIEAARSAMPSQKRMSTLRRRSNQVLNPLSGEDRDDVGREHGVEVASENAHNEAGQPSMLRSWRTIEELAHRSSDNSGRIATPRSAEFRLMHVAKSLGLSDRAASMAASDLQRWLLDIDRDPPAVLIAWKRALLPLL